MEHCEFNSKGQLVRKTRTLVIEYEYDDYGNLIHTKQNDGFETWSEYNSLGQVIHFRNTEHFEYWSTYDDKGNLLEYKTNKTYNWSRP